MLGALRPPKPYVWLLVLIWTPLGLVLIRGNFNRCFVSNKNGARQVVGVMGPHSFRHRAKLERENPQVVASAAAVQSSGKWVEKYMDVHSCRKARITHTIALGVAVGAFLYAFELRIIGIDFLGVPNSGENGRFQNLKELG